MNIVAKWSVTPMLLKHEEQPIMEGWAESIRVADQAPIGLTAQLRPSISIDGEVHRPFAVLISDNADIDDAEMTLINALSIAFIRGVVSATALRMFELTTRPDRIVTLAELIAIQLRDNEKFESPTHTYTADLVGSTVYDGKGGSFAIHPDGSMMGAALAIADRITKTAVRR